MGLMLLKTGGSGHGGAWEGGEGFAWSMAQFRAVAAVESSSSCRGNQGGGTSNHPSPAHTDPGMEKLFQQLMRTCL